MSLDDMFIDLPKTKEFWVKELRLLFVEDEKGHKFSELSEEHQRIRIKRVANEIVTGKRLEVSKKRILK